MADSKGKTIWYQVYEPFGVTYLLNAKDNNNKFWFAGKEKDKTGLSYFGARYYSENQGRFMSPDPVDVKPELPNTFNRYVYANNNPYKYVDPDGKFPTNIPSIDYSEAAFGFVMGGIAGYVHTGTAKGAMIGAAAGGLTGYVANPLSAWSAGMIAAAGGGPRAAQAVSIITRLSTYTGGAATGNYLLTGDFNLSGAFFGALGSMVGGKLINPMAAPVESKIHFLLNSSYSYLTGELMGRATDSVIMNGTKNYNNLNKIQTSMFNLNNVGNSNIGGMCYANNGELYGKF